MKFLLILLGFIGVLSYEQTSTYVPEQSKTVTKSKTPSQSIDTFNDIDINLRDIVIDNDIDIRRKNKKRKNRRRKKRNRRTRTKKYDYDSIDDDDDDIDDDDENDVIINQQNYDSNYY